MVTVVFIYYSEYISYFSSKAWQVTNDNYTSFKWNIYLSELFLLNLHELVDYLLEQKLINSWIA
jgi:hypothetical protein